MPLLHKYYSTLPRSLDRLEVCGSRLKTTERGPILDMQLESLEKRQAANGEVNWVTAAFMAAFHHDTTTLARYVPDLAKDKFHVWITKYHYVPMVVLGVILLTIGGLPFLMWGIFMRTVVGLHATWLVNSATHSWGTRRFATRDLSTNSWWVALLTFGEGWHNNHHAHPTSARHGLKWYEIDINWYGIWALKKLGLARQIQKVNLSQVIHQKVPAPNGRLIQA